MKKHPDQNLNIIGDFIRYTIILFVLFFIFGGIYGFIYEFSLVSQVFNPLIYSIGISLIIIVISHDINDILLLVGRGKEQQLGSHIKYSKEVQEISMLMSQKKFDPALRKVNNLLQKDPGFSAALIMRGEILLQGFHKNREARECFNTVLKLSKEGDQQHKLAEALKASTYAQ